MRTKHLPQALRRIVVGLTLILVSSSRQGPYERWAPNGGWQWLSSSDPTSIALGSTD
jgi:hypothetical protein